MNDKATVQIPDDVIQPIVRQQICAGIMAAMGKPEELVESVVKRAMERKVGRDGKVSQYSHDNKYDMVEILAMNAIEDAVKQAIKEWVANNQKLIQEAVSKALTKKTGPFAKALMDGLMESVKQAWSFRCSVGFTEEK